MNGLILTIIGGGMGLLIRFYLSYLVAQIVQNVHLRYCEQFPDQTDEELILLESLLDSNEPPPLKSGQYFQSFLVGAAIFGVCSILFSNMWLALWMGCYFSLLIPICILDWYYKLIPIHFCQQLIVLGIAGAYWHILPIELTQSLESCAIGFGVFWIIYQLALGYHKQECFGRGDYWLIAGLASFFPWQHLPVMSLIASLLAMVYAFYSKWHRQFINEIPFAPFLAVGGSSVLMLHLANL